MMMNERLPAHPRRLPVLTFLAGALIGLIVLRSDGGGFWEPLQLLGGVLGVGANGEGWLRVLLWRMCRTFTMVSLALLIGMSFALAVAVLLGGWWRPLRQGLGWAVRWLGALPPMAWALAWLFLLVQVWGLPVESLFPNRPGAALDSLLMKMGRGLWSLLAPALAVAFPVFALALRACLLRIDHAWSQPLVTGLRARGFSLAFIRHQHLTPRLWPHVVRLAWPLGVLSLAFAIPVEEIFMLDGWGSFMAGALRARDTNSLAAAIYAGGAMLALWFGLFAWLEQPLAAAGRLTPLRLRQHPRAWIAGAVLLVMMLSANYWPVEAEWWKASLRPWWPEVKAALTLACMGLLIHVAGLLSGWSLALVLVVALLLPLKSALFLMLALALAVSEWLKGRMELKRVQESDYLLVSRMMGGPATLSLWRHAVLVLWPTLAAGWFRMAAAALMWMSALTYFGYGADAGLPNPAWGALTYQRTAAVLDDLWPALMPMLWVGVWCLCFQWFARGFGTGGLPLGSFLPPARLRKKKKR